MKKAIYIAAEVIVGFFAGMCAGVRSISFKVEKEMDAYEKDKQRFVMNAELMNEWIQKIHSGKSLADLCKKKNYLKVAVYGMNYMGERVVEELAAGNIDIRYGIDQAAGSIKSHLKVVALEDDLENVDAVIVTPIYYFDQIERDLQKKLTCPIVSLEQMVYEM